MAMASRSRARLFNDYMAKRGNSGAVHTVGKYAPFLEERVSVPERTDMDEILKLNPHLTPDDLESARALLQKLRRHGSVGPGYRLAPPFGGRRVSVGDNGDDPRTIHLRQRPHNLT